MTDTIRGAKGGGSQPHAATEAPDSLHSIAYARILDLVSEGEIQGFKHGAASALQDIYLNETPIANADGTLNFKNVQVDTRTGTQAQGYMPGFPDVENETAVGLELKSATPYTQSLTDLTLSAVRVRLSVPSLQKSNTSTGDIAGYTIQYKIELQTDGGTFATMITSAFTGKTTSKYERSHRISLPPATTGWVLRITRLTANQNLATIADTTTVESYTAIVDAKFRYPNSALVGLIIDASQFQSIPTRAYDLYGRIISVPTNYNPVARTYATTGAGTSGGAWDGTFKPAWTNNPAWIFYDLAINTRYGLGNYVSAALLNKWALYTIAQYCDGSVPNGFGAMEPRFTCNLYLQAQADAYKVLQDLASVFRGMAYWAGGAIQSVADMPVDPVYTYTQANVINGKFTYQGSPRKTRFTVALVSWNDPQDFGRAKVEYVPDNPGIARYGIQKTSITGFGCTSQGQAHRIGLWTLLTSRLETETITFGVGLDGTIAAPGQIIRVADAARAGKRQGGRISAATTTAITVDAAPTVAVGDSLTCTLPSGVTETHTVSAVAGNVISVAAPGFSATPLPEAAWVVESTTLAAQTFRVVSVLENGTGPDLSFTITALAHNASKFAAIDTGAPISVPPVTAIPPSSQPAPAAVSLTSVETAGQVLSSTLLNIQWSSAASAVWYEAEWQKDSGEWQSLGKLRGLSADLHNAKPGVYLARVRAVNASGVGSVSTVSLALNVADQTKQPTTVAAIQTEVNQAQADANTANAALANIASDNLLSQGEKPVVIRDYNVITTEQAGIDVQATAFGITTEKTSYDNAVTALTNYLGTLTTPTLWSDLSGNTTIVGANFRNNFASVYTTRQTLLNAIYAAAKSKSDAAQGAANTAVGQVTQLPVINGGFDIAPTGYGWTADSGTGWYTDTGSNSPGVQPNCARHNGTPSPTTGAYRNNGLAYCQPGQTYKTQALIKAVGANGSCGVYISWCDANGFEISTTPGNTVSGTTTNGSYAVGQAPAGTVFARTCIGYYGQSAGTYYVDNVVCTQYPSSVDEVPDGTSYGKTLLAGLVNGSIPLAGAGKSLLGNPTFLRNTLGIPLGTIVAVGGYACDNWKLGPETGSGVWVLNTEAGDQLFRVVTGAVVPNGTQFEQRMQSETFPVTPGQTLVMELSVSLSFASSPPAGVTIEVFLAIALTDYAGNYITGSVTQVVQIVRPSGALIRRGSFVVPATFGGTAVCGAYAEVQGYVINTSGSTYTAGALPYDMRIESVNVYSVQDLGTEVVGTLSTARNMPQRTVTNIPAKVPSVFSYSATTTSATITLAAFTVLSDQNVSYNAMSVGVSGTAGSTVTYYLYFDDPTYAGGTQTLVATTNGSLVYAGAGRVYAGSLSVTYPASGTGSGSGGGGGGVCVCSDMWLDEETQAIDAARGFLADCIDLPTSGMRKFRRRMLGMETSFAPCVRITTEQGAVLECSESTPFDLPEGGMTYAPQMEGLRVVTDRGIETVRSVVAIGEREVCHQHYGGVSYAAGAEHSHRIYSHNSSKVFP